MKKTMWLILFSALTFNVYSQNQLLIRDNTPINYKNVNASALREALDAVKKSADQKIAAIVAASSNQTVENTLLAFDEMQYELSDLSSRFGLVSATFSDNETRTKAFELTNEFQIYANSIFLNEPFYKAMKQFSTTKTSSLSESQKKFINDIVIGFEKNGMKLNADERKKLTALNEKMIELANSFDQNIAASRDSIVYIESELKGVPADDMKPWKRSDGKYVVYINQPNYVKVLENADSKEVRKNIYMKYNNRAFPANLAVLDSLLYYRDQYAKLLGFKSYASYAVVDKMAGSPEKVWEFENDLIQKLTPLVKTEMQRLKDFRKEINPSDAGEFQVWDFSYYTKKLLNSKYQLNTDEVSQYFEMNNTLKGMFSVYEKLLGIQIKETSGVPVWDPKVKSYELYKDGKKSGTFYLDLYPRANKYTHFACFPISSYKKNANSETLPVAALVCNFPEGSDERPSLLKHNDVITLFHEFGHLVHWELCHAPISSQNSFGVKGDFVEAPSQFLENWCWEYDALKLFAKHYKTGEVLPSALFKKMKDAQLVNSGYASMRQVTLGTIDFTYEDRYSEAKSKGIMQVSKEKFELGQLPFPEGSHFICSFTHLSGYGANYYGYLWSKVFAQDMFSVFKEKGVMDQATGIRYRKIILENGSMVDEMKIVEEFLGRKPDSKAFLQSLGIK